MDISNNIQFHRKRLGLSQEELGQMLLVSRQTISLWEKGQTMPTIDNLLRLKEIFGITLDSLFGDDVPAEEPEIPQEVYDLSLEHDDIRELRRFCCKPYLHKMILSLVVAIVIFLLAVGNTDESLVGTWLGLLFCVIVGTILRYFKNRKAAVTTWKRFENTSFHYRLFENYFEVNRFQNNEMISTSKHYYKDISKFYQTKHFLLPEHNGSIYFFQKDALYKDSRFFSHLSKNPATKIQRGNIVIWKTVSLILFIASLASIFMGIGTFAVLEEVNHLFTQNMWVMFLYTPIPVASVIFGFIAKAKGYPYKKNVIAGIVMTAVLCLYGCFTFIFARLYNDNPIGVERIEYYLDIDIPEYDHIATQNIGVGNDATDPTYIWYNSNAYFDVDGTQELVDRIQSDDRFLNGMPNELTGLASYMSLLSSCDYVLFYNVDTGQCNAYPEESGIYRMISIALYRDDMCLNIIEYNLDYKAD